MLPSSLSYWSRIYRYHVVVLLDGVDKVVGCGLGVQVATRLCTRSVQLPSTRARTTY